MKVGMLGAGRIAGWMAQTINRIDKSENIVNYAIGSRDQAKADAFARENGFAKAYGSYEQLVADPQVDLVYVATPHSHHYDAARMAIEAGKPVIVEKSFTANAREAKALIDLAHERKVFLTEAMWTRYMPLSLKVKELLDAGAIGKPLFLSASLCIPMPHKVKLFQPELAGGALLDVGVYCINFARMYFGGDIAKTVSTCQMHPSGVDIQDTISFNYSDGRVANLWTSGIARSDRRGVICGDGKFITVENINCPESVALWDNYQIVEEYKRPATQLSGYEYEMLACRDALAQGLLESPYMPHSETLAMMQQMDALRAEWGVHFPMD
ncbi:MAG: Gfo/Idh/MocA family oxidoreductase [Bacteroidales bacterium]|nr:Gfo/Idh/MocA family oxidoreductase [Bacteroidales bacterium]